MQKPHIVENALSKDALDFLTKFCEDNPNAFRNEGSQAIGQFIDKTISYKVLHSSMPEPFGKLERTMAHCRFIAQKTILDNWNSYVYPDNTELTYWDPGDSMSLHADNTWHDGLEDHIKELEHPTDYRTHSALFYLNDNYDGGEIYFPEFDLEIKPKAGSLLTFPSGNDHRHGVNEVLKRKRFTIAIWYTNQINYLE